MQITINIGNINLATSEKKLFFYGKFGEYNRTSSIDIALALANYFNVSLDYLVGATDFPYPLSEKVVNIINQANNPEELIIKINELR